MNLKDLLWPDVPDRDWNDWRWQLKNRVKGKKGLERLGEAAGIDLSGSIRAQERYRWAATPYYLSLIRSKDILSDPVGRQVVPSVNEVLSNGSDASCDPLKERFYSPLKGLIHRYRDRVVVLASSFCASYCRHCNRKRTWSRPECITLSEESLERIKKYLCSKPHIREVLVSGGDPLLLPLNELERLLAALRSVPNIEIIRIGTRVPVVLPMRITKNLCLSLKKNRPIWLNTHFNHPVELTEQAKEAIDRLQLSGIPVSNQSVLLRGVNDDYETLHGLFCRLQAVMVRPYYLFQCDQVAGTEHFWVPLKKGIEMMERMWGHTGGMCIPNFVADLPGGAGKARLLPAHLLKIEGGQALFSTFEGKTVMIKIPET